MKILALVFAMISSVHADEIRFESGEMELVAYVEMVADALDLQINASMLPRSDSQKVGLRQTGPFTREQALSQLFTTLALNGFTIVHDADLNLYRVLRMRDARDENIPLLKEGDSIPDNDSLVTYVHRLEHFPPDVMARNLRSFSPANSRLIPDEANAQILITDTAHSLGKYRAIMERLDTPQSAQEAREHLRSMPTQAKDCPTAEAPDHTVRFIVLYSLVALVLGFLLRGYVIRRIEGGL